MSRAGWSAGTLSASKLYQSSSISGPCLHVEAQPREDGARCRRASATPGAGARRAPAARQRHVELRALQLGLELELLHPLDGLARAAPRARPSPRSPPRPAPCAPRAASLPMPPRTADSSPFLPRYFTRTCVHAPRRPACSSSPLRASPRSAFSRSCMRESLLADGDRETKRGRPLPRGDPGHFETFALASGRLGDLRRRRRSPPDRARRDRRGSSGRWRPSPSSARRSASSTTSPARGPRR